MQSSMGEGQIQKTGKNGRAADAPGTGYRVDIVDSFAAWERLSGSWNTLLASSRADTVFLTWEWLYSWAESFLQDDRRLFILAVYYGQELAGIAPWCVRRVSGNLVRVNQIEFLGSPEAGSDYLDVVIRKGREQDVTDVLYHFLFHEGRSLWDCLLLRDIPSDSLFLLYFQDKVEHAGKYAELSKGSYCPLVTLPEDRDWLPGSSPKRKARFRQDLARLEKNGAWDHRVVTGDALTEGLDEFFSFYNEKTGHDGSALQAFLKKIDFRRKTRDLVQIDFLSMEKKTIAALLHLRYQRELLLYLMAVDKGSNSKISAGNLLVGLCLRQAHEGGLTRYDFLKGNERYKFSWADSGRTSLRISISQKKLSPVLYTTARFVKYAAKMLLR